jgi:hypothetical protein
MEPTPFSSLFDRNFTRCKFWGNKVAFFQPTVDPEQKQREFAWRLPPAR